MSRGRRSGRQRDSALVQDCAGNAIQAVDLRGQNHPVRSYPQTLCPLLEIGTESLLGEEPDQEFWHRREVHPSDETLESPCYISILRRTGDNTIAGQLSQNRMPLRIPPCRAIERNLVLSRIR